MMAENLAEEFDRLHKVEHERDALLEAARRLRTAWHPEQAQTAMVLLDAAIAKAKGEDDD